ncbi:helix-turn-helix domain-containing protein [Hymenobacter swuensis]|uniref:HTH cro/C1-type domain-containing protein n=1 Tax=Hymenobacter swuensis DY53 TaxID=1227739 RepID=W8F209_9BACT|nr:helix-turn-helix transcriptional regulator [Hymenobacter swuensis]AHJ98052.1 hypothetical protein Hsw_2457 [Hymenobacter swuensis DY53]
MLDRIRELLTTRQLTSTQFADAIGVSRPVISHILSGRNKPSLEVVQKVLAAFPDVSVSWLLNGSGSMLEVQAVERVNRPPDAPRRRAAPDATPIPSLVAATAPVIAPAAAPEPAVLLVAASAPAPDPVLVPAALPEPATLPGQPALKQDPEPIGPPPASSVSNGVDIAQGLADPGKRIRRIVIFYQDGTFADYQPETTR